MAGRDHLLVLEGLERGDDWADTTDVADLLREARFLLDEEDGNIRIYRHEDTGEPVYLRMSPWGVHPNEAATIASIIRNYWP